MDNSYRTHWQKAIHSYRTGGTYFDIRHNSERAPAVHKAKEVYVESKLPPKLRKKRAEIVNNKLVIPRGDQRILAQVLSSEIGSQPYSGPIPTVVSQASTPGPIRAPVPVPEIPRSLGPLGSPAPPAPPPPAPPAPARAPAAQAPPALTPPPRATQTSQLAPAPRIQTDF